MGNPPPNNRSKTTPNIHIPEEIIYEIIIRSPLKSIARFKLASKYWNTLLSNNPLDISRSRRRLLLGDHLLFCRSHVFTHQIYSIGCTNLVRRDTLEEFSELKHEYYKRGFVNPELSSCNGLVLVSDPSYVDFILWNPVTRESVFVNATSWKRFRARYYFRRGNSRYGRRGAPLTDRCYYLSYYVKVLALCYNGCRDEYGVLLVLMCKYRVGDDEYEHMRVLFLNCNTGELRGRDYRGFRNMRPRINMITRAANSVTIVCGEPHWLMDSTRQINKKNEVVYFDVEEKRLRRRVMPTELELVGLGVLKGQTQLVIVVKNANANGVEMWVMREYGVWDSWTKMFAIGTNNIPYTLDILGYTSSGNLILDIFVNKLKLLATGQLAPVNRHALLGYNPRNHAAKLIDLSLLAHPDRFPLCGRGEFFITAHEPSLVAPPQPQPQPRAEKNDNNSVLGVGVAIFGYDPAILYGHRMVAKYNEDGSTVFVLSEHDPVLLEII